MAKKKTRKQQYQRPRPASQPMAAPVATRPAVAAATATAATSVAPKPAADLKQEYQYVISDLKRIGITAASMFAVLIVLALLLT